MQVSRYLSLILLGLALDSCSERYFDSKTEGEKLLARDAEWADLATAGKDVEKVVSYWSDDAVLIFPGQPVLGGKAAIRGYVAYLLARRQACLYARHGRPYSAWAKWRYDDAAPSWNISVAVGSG